MSVDKIQHKRKLPPKQKKFCKLFATDPDFFGNGVQAYLEAYDIKPTGYKSAATCAHRLLKDVEILAYINDIMTETGFNDAHADKQLSFLMTQNAEMGVKLGAIREFNALRQRVVKKTENAVNTNINIIIKS